ncbi:MAG: error-prone DNA polymerase [Hyphomicrobiaceae bacterium]|nr:error-prone DNA polymerase [Hyphomicrobiaceae bacterium]
MNTAAGRVPPAYAELQVTTNFSFLRGASHADELIAQAKALGLSAIAVTDRNTLAGVVRAHTAAKEAGLQLIVGARLDLADAPSLLCLPKDRAAYGRLSRLISVGQSRAEKGECHLRLADVAAHGEGQIFIALPPETWDWREALWFSRTRVDRSFTTTNAVQVDARRTGAGPQSRPDRPSPGRWRGDVEDLSQCSSGCSSGGKGGLGDGSPTRAATFASDLARIRAMLPETAALHLALTRGYHGEDRARLGALAHIADAAGITTVVTNDVLYHGPHRRPLQDVLTCVREGTTIGQAGLRLEANAERHLKSPAEMAHIFSGYEDALARTLSIAEQCRFSLDELVYEYPEEPTPPGRTPQDYLEEITWQGAAWRFPGGVPDKVRATLQKELELIDELCFAPYFLTVYDIVTFARSRGILAQGRGSAANSAVCYCLGITAVNPVEVDLLFERFVSHARREPPDIDVDFEHERREEVIQYIYQRYGRDRAGLAATVISYRARSAVRDVGKAMGLSEDTVAALAGMVWGTRSGGVLGDQRIREAGLDPTDPLLAAVIALTEELIGFPRHLSQHVGGFVLTRGPLVEVVPVGNAAMEGRTFIEWDKDDLAALGLLKIDVLALGMLTCIHRAFDLLEEHHGLPISLASVPREDAAVYDMLCAADSLGVFQVESRAQMNMLPRLKPRNFYDLVIEVAIVRPGPIQGDMVHPYLRRRDGLELETYPAPSPEHGDKNELRQILGKTKGVPLFQEQAMRIAMDAAKFSDEEVNELRKAMATFRRRGTIGQLEEKMVSRMVARGYAPDFARRCFSQIKGFGDYGFPESHAASFAHLVYVSSWLKCHYPAAFACALLNSQPMGFYAPAQIVRDAREHGVEARAVDVNHSDWDCALEGEDLNCDSLSGPGAQPIEVKRGWAGVSGFIPMAGAAAGSRSAGTTSWPDGPVAGQLVEPEAVDMPASPVVWKTSYIPQPALRLGLRQVDGLRQDEAEKLVAARAAGGPFRDMADLKRRARISQATLERLAAADAFRSMAHDRRQALWEVKGLAPADALPLFAWSAAKEEGAEPEVALPLMPLPEHVVNDYQTLRLSLKAHPMQFLRSDFSAEGISPCAALRGMKDGTFVRIAGVVLVRQRPGSAKGVVFMTLEDETGVANTVVWPNTLEKFRKVVMAARLIVVTGRIQRHQNIIHIVSQRLEDRSPWLARLADSGPEMKVPIANADEVLRPDPGSARGSVGHPRWASHPRDARIIPKSRDFH